MKHKITITFRPIELPSLNLTNSLTATWRNRAEMTGIMRENGRINAKQAINQWEARSGLYWEPLEGSLALEIHLFYPNLRRRDILNLDDKAAIDGLTDAGIWLDDKQIDDGRYVRHLDRENPRYEFWVFELEPGDAAYGSRR